MDGRHPHPAAALDEHVRRAAGALVDPGEVVVSWVVLAATRNASDGGTVLFIPSNAAMPAWEAKGIVGDALDLLWAGSLYGGGEDVSGRHPAA